MSQSQPAGGREPSAQPPDSRAGRNIADDRPHPAAAGMPDLRIVPTASLLLHEECDPDRVVRLRRRLDTDGVLRNPPVVAPLDSSTYVVLDGANRVTALTEEGLPDQLVQIVAYDDPAVVLDVWAHLLADGSGLLRGDGGELELRAMPEDGIRAGLDDGWLACGIVTRTGAYGLAAHGALSERVRLLARVVARYKGLTPIFRVQPAPNGAAATEPFAREVGSGAALVLFPRLTKPDVRAIARLPVKLPTGITRHIIPLRALRVNVDLSLLRAAESTPAKQDRLDEMIRTRVADHHVRHYPEATILFDE